MSQSKGEAAKVVNAFYLTERMKLSGQKCSVVVKCSRRSSEKFLQQIMFTVNFKRGLDLKTNFKECH